MKKLLGSVLLALLAVGLGGAERVTGTVAASNLNIRRQPSTAAPVLGRAALGAEVTALAANADWVKIVLPEGADTYISQRYVKEGRTTAKIHVRSGPGTAFSSYGTLAAGTAVKVLGEPVETDWVRIAPPDFAVGYVAARYLRVDAAKLEKLAGETPAAKTAEKAAEKAVEVHVTVEDADRPFSDLPVEPGSGRNVTVSGMLFPVKSAAPGVRFALAVEKNGKYEVNCFIHTQGSKKFDAFANQQVKLTGIRYAVPNWKNPVMRVIRIAPVEAGP